MKDRAPTYPGRVKLEPVSSSEANLYTLEMADVPTEQGTPLNRATLLADDTGALMGLGSDATPNDMFRAIANKVNTNITNISSLQTDLADLISYGTTDMTSGTTPLETGKVYFYYE